MPSEKPRTEPGGEIRAEHKARNRRHSGAMSRFRNVVIGAKIGARRRERVFQRAASPGVRPIRKTHAR